MDIAQEETDTKGRYTATLDGHTGEMTYSRSSPHLIIVDHTFVPDALRGKGVGQALALHAIEEARKGSWKIIPLCPFMRPGHAPSGVAGCNPGLTVQGTPLSYPSARKSESIFRKHAASV